MNNFEKLAGINVNAHIEKKNGLSYLSWAWAVDQLLRADPEANWEYLEPRTFGDSMMVFCRVTAFGVTRSCQLPVMDHRNKCIKDPDAFAVNTAMQRCLVKAIALHGLGLYIYAGEDLPLEEREAKQDKPQSAKITPTTGAWESMTEAQQIALTDIALEVIARLGGLTADEAADAHEYLEAQNLTHEEKIAIWTRFDSKQRAAIKKAGEAKTKKAA